MRISSDQQFFITNQIKQIRPQSDIYLFGSRADDQQKGGDIDILIMTPTKLSLKEKLNFKRAFYNRFGEQKLDLVCFSHEDESPFKDLILESAKKS